MLDSGKLRVYLLELHKLFCDAQVIVAGLDMTASALDPEGHFTHEPNVQLFAEPYYSYSGLSCHSVLPSSNIQRSKSCSSLIKRSSLDARDVG